MLYNLFGSIFLTVQSCIC